MIITVTYIEPRYLYPDEKLARQRVVILELIKAVHCVVSPLGQATRTPDISFHS